MHDTRQEAVQPKNDLPQIRKIRPENRQSGPMIKSNLSQEYLVDIHRIDWNTLEKWSTINHFTAK